MKEFCLYFDKKKHKCVSFIVHYKGLTLSYYMGHKLYIFFKHGRR